jgi:hemerythrin-like domain-containing protein
MNTNELAEALERAHAALLEDLFKLEEVALSASGDGLVVLRARLDATNTHILQHFAFEEENGYLDAVRKREPRLERAIQQLAEEHRQLRQSIEALVGEARAATSLDPVLREGVRRWIKNIRQHEARENDLVLGAFNQDISPED